MANLTEIDRIKDGINTTIIYNSPVKYKYIEMSTRKKYPYQLNYIEEHIWIAGEPDDPDSIKLTTWQKQYKVQLEEGYGAIAKSTYKDNEKFSEKGYKDWEIYLYYTKGNGEIISEKHYKNTIPTENKTLDLLNKALKTLSTRIRLSKKKDNIIKWDDKRIISGSI